MADTLIPSLHTLKSLEENLRRLVSDSLLKDLGQASLQRGYFTPNEDQALRTWFAHFLAVRFGLFSIVYDMRRRIPKFPTATNAPQWPAFIVGYCAACLIAMGDRFVIKTARRNSILQRKLNEPDSALNIPKKQYTQIRRSWTHPLKAIRMLKAMKHAEHYRPQLQTYQQDPQVGYFASRLPEFERALLPGFSSFAKAYLRYRRHSIRRRGASMRQKFTFSLLETSGRWLSKKTPRSIPKKVSAVVRSELLALLQPGDILVTRHHKAVTNIFLPGYWPHAALFVGFPHQVAHLQLNLDHQQSFHWHETHCFLEALADGVRFRPAEQTLNVDALVVLRPQIDPTLMGTALQRAITHEGKGYNFDFDFFRSDRLVCTEVIYRAFDGLGSIHCELARRSGRPTLSAEDLLDLALLDQGFKPIAIFGSPGCRKKLVTGPSVSSLLQKSYPFKKNKSDTKTNP